MPLAAGLKETGLVWVTLSDGQVNRSILILVCGVYYVDECSDDKCLTVSGRSVAIEALAH